MTTRPKAPIFFSCLWKRVLICLIDIRPRFPLVLRKELSWSCSGLAHFRLELSSLERSRHTVLEDEVRKEKKSPKCFRFILLFCVKSTTLCTIFFSFLTQCRVKIVFLYFTLNQIWNFLASKTAILILRKIHQNCYSHPLELSKTVFKFLIN